MSEYQYYEFQAIDRPLSEKEIAKLRSYSTRAEITPTSFSNEYHWGNFKGDADAWMEKYFDAFLYFANWGTHIFMLRLPSRLLDMRTAQLYSAAPYYATAREKNGHIVLRFQSEHEDGSEWEDDDYDYKLSSLISLRAELARGDLRNLYLGWLLGVQNGELDDDDIEPPVPDGLAQLSASLESFATFLRIDDDLLQVAAIASAPLQERAPKLADVRAWLNRMPNSERDELLARLISGDGGALVSELRQRLLRERYKSPPALSAKRRTVAELRTQTERAAVERERRDAERAAREDERRKRETAVARAKQLDKLVGQEAALWRRVESLIATKLPKRYDQALEVLTDLRDLASRSDGADFLMRLESLRAAHARKPTLIARLHKLASDRSA
jgi:hypothetical protein